MSKSTLEFYEASQKIIDGLKTYSFARGSEESNQSAHMVSTLAKKTLELANQEKSHTVGARHLANAHVAFKRSATGRKDAYARKHGEGAMTEGHKRFDEQLETATTILANTLEVPVYSKPSGLD